MLCAFLLLSSLVDAFKIFKRINKHRFSSMCPMAKSLLDIPVKMCVAVNSLLSSTSFLAFKRSATSIFCCPKPSVLPPYCPWHQNFWRLPCAQGQLAILLQCWYRARSLSTIMAGHIARCGKASWRCMLSWHGLLDMINSLHRNTPLSMKAACSIRITWICPHWFVIISFRCWSITDADKKPSYCWDSQPFVAIFRT